MMKDGSFIADLLKVLRFEESKLKPYIKFADECSEALSKGSKNGGISAFFYVEALSIQVKYMITTYRTDGLHSQLSLFSFL